VGIPVACYLTLDPGGIAKGFAVVSGGVLDESMDLLRHMHFFLLEAGFLGFAILLIRRSGEVVLALIVLTLLPMAYFGPGNDLVMRASIPSLAVLAVGACLSLAHSGADPKLRQKKILLVCLLAIGAVTPVQEFARAAVLDSWPLNLQATLIAVNCNTYPPHYVAHLDSQAIRHLLRAPHRLAVGPVTRQTCQNPASELMWPRGRL
jgi:hypothetical protein